MLLAGLQSGVGSAGSLPTFFNGRLLLLMRRLCIFLYQWCI